MDKETLVRLAREFAAASPLNRVAEAAAIHPRLAGMVMYREPILGVADADDPYFLELRRPEVIGPHFRLPREWLPGAAAVVSFFLPYTGEVIRSNRLDRSEPSPQWLHARIEGNDFLDALATHLAEAFRAAGHKAVVPSLHADFWCSPGPLAREGTGRRLADFTSNWSERHVAHVAGLGTFGLSAGLITREGIAGRFGSVVATLAMEPDARPYSRHDEYCTHCGACIARCPVRAITASGKDHAICGTFVNGTMERYHPRYGCGKCQVAVPCERRIPPRKA